MNVKDSKISFKNNTKIIFMNIIIPINLGISLDFKELREFSKKFPFFLSEFKSGILVSISNNNIINGITKLYHNTIAL